MSAPQTLAELVALAKSRTAPVTVSSTAPPAHVPTPGGAVASIPPDDGKSWHSLGISTGTELVTGREIAAVAAKLAKSKSDDKQTVGRAMLRALRGEVWAPDGSRNVTMLKIAAELIEAYPNLDPGSVVLAFSAAISNAQVSADSKFTEEKLLSMLERVQDERQNRLNMLASLGGLVGDGPVPVWTVPEAPGITPDPDRARAAELNAAGFDTLIVRANGDFYLRTPDRGTYDWKLPSALDLRVKMVNLFGRENSTVITHQEGEFVGAEKICEVYARVADRVVHDYTSPATTFELTTATLKVGLPAALPEPREDARVAAWLQELAGGSEGDLTELYDWIASTTREHIDRPAAALVISGAKDAGKSLFMLALAGTWGVLPVKLGNAVERFNGALLTSPFWHADERMPEEMTEACFRETVPARSRLVEPKGREKVELRGCGRLVFSINSVHDLHVGTSQGPDAVDAVAGRIAFFDCSRRKDHVVAAQEAFRLPNYDLDLPAMVAHMRWVQVTHSPRPQRFLGARLNNSAARSLVLQQSVRGIERVLDAVAEYLHDPLVWEKAYRPGGSFTAPGNVYPLVTKQGKLYVWGSELAGRLAMKEHIRALDSICKPGRKQIRFGYFRGSYREIDVERFLEVREAGPGTELYAVTVNTLATDTWERLGVADDA